MFTNVGDEQHVPHLHWHVVSGDQIDASGKLVSHAVAIGTAK